MYLQLYYRKNDLICENKEIIIIIIIISTVSLVEAALLHMYIELNCF